MCHTSASNWVDCIISGNFPDLAVSQTTLNTTTEVKPLYMYRK